MLTAYKITYADGSTSSTNMAAHVTLDNAKKYFIGERFDLGVYPQENMQEVVKVEHIKTYNATFHGRTKDAIGITYAITDTTYGTDEESARLNLYDKYEHIRGLKLEEVTK